MKKTLSKVAPLTAAIADYKEALHVFASHQTLPALMNAIDKAIKANAGFAEILDSVTTFLSEPDDKFWGAYGSRYFRELEDDLDIGDFRPHEPTLQSGLKIIWRCVSGMKSDDLITFESTLVNWSEWDTLTKLCGQGSSSDAYESTVTTTTETRPSRLSQAAYDLAASIDQAHKQSIALAETCASHKLSMIPWAFVVIAESGESDTELVQELQRLSAYLEKYFGAVPAEDTLRKLPTEQAEDLSKLLCAAIFSRLLQAHGFNIDTVDSCLRTRLDLIHSPSFSNSPKLQAHYIASIVNASLLCSALGSNSLKLGILTLSEILHRDFDFIDARDPDLLDDHDLLNLSLIPGDAIVHLIPSIQPWEGHRNGDIDLTDLVLLLRMCTRRTSWDVDLNDFQDEVFKKLGLSDSKLGHEVAKYAAQNLSSVEIPLKLLDSLPRLAEPDCFSDYRVLDSLSRALRRIDVTGEYETKFVPSTWLLDFIDLELGPDQHPALFATKFSNKERFLDFRPSSWLAFVEALHSEGQVHYACVLMAFVFKINGIFHSIGSSLSDRLPPREVSKVLEQLRPHRSFRLIEESLRDYLSVLKTPEPEYYGVYTAFVSSTSVVKLESKGSSVDTKARLEKELMEKVPNLKRLNRQSWEGILVAYCMTRETRFEPYHISGEAVCNYAAGFESEIAQRVNFIPESMLDHLLAHDIKAKVTKSGLVFDGLGAYAHLLEKYPSLPEVVKPALQRLKALAQHKNAEEFCTALKEMSKLRNTYSHGKYDRQSPRCKQDLLLVEKFLFAERGLEILCDTVMSTPRI